MVDFEVKSQEDNKLSFVLKDSSPAYSNALRRVMLNEVPVMAIEDVEIVKNSSALYDEVVAHRLGLLPLTTDLKSYELPESEKDIEERKAKCTVQMTLKAKGPKTVYASDLKTADPKIKPVYPKMPIVKLLKDQEIELSAIATLGKGKDHAKWSPGHAWYTYKPIFEINNKNVEKFKDMYPPEIFNKKGKIDEKLILKHNLTDAVAHVNEEIVKVTYDDSEYLFFVESWGQITPKEILMQACDIFDDRLEEVRQLL